MKETNSRFSLIGYFLFLIPLTLTLAFAVIIFDLLQTKLNNPTITAIFLFIYIIMISLIFSFIDIYRRRQMIDKPVEVILTATKKIASGDFNIKLHPLHPYNKYDCYDQIMENLNKMATELNKSEILKKDFISNVSHEIKTPLALMQNYAKLLANPSLDEETKNKYLTSLQLTTTRLSNLVSNILKLNKLENQAIIETLEKINIGELLRNSTLQFLDIIEDKNIALSCDIEDIEMETDPSFVEIIFNNLLSNAIKFTEPNGTIKISLTSADNLVVLQVKDSGCGMSQEVGKHIFEKFYQGDTSHSSEGNGLGLALVKRIIDIMGGEISVTSQEKKGSTFTVKLKRGKNE